MNDRKIKKKPNHFLNWIPYIFIMLLCWFVIIPAIPITFPIHDVIIGLIIAAVFKAFVYIKIKDKEAKEREEEMQIERMAKKMASNTEEQRKQQQWRQQKKFRG